MRRLLAATFAVAVLSTSSIALAQTLIPLLPPPPGPRHHEEKSDELPLTPTRNVEVETNEGTWISLDVSPDGQKIVFELLGDLYAMPVAGGAATRLTTGPALDSQPRWSPDGKRIVFLSRSLGRREHLAVRRRRQEPEGP